MEERIIEIYATGEKMEFIKTRKDTDGQFLEFIQTLPNKRGGFIPEHIHLDIDETFVILEGKATYSINGVEHAAEAGETISIPAKTPHINPYNREENRQLVLRRTLTPELGTEHFYRKQYQLANAHKLNGKSQFGKIQLAVIAKHTASKTYFTNTPKWFQFLNYRVIGTFGELIGYTHKL